MPGKEQERRIESKESKKTKDNRRREAKQQAIKNQDKGIDSRVEVELTLKGRELALELDLAPFTRKRKRTTRDLILLDS